MQRKELGPLSNYDNLGHFLHDLAQPLATVSGLVDLLLLEMNERDRLFNEVQLISEQLEKIISIIGTMRQIARRAAECEAKAQKSSQSPLS